MASQQGRAAASHRITWLGVGVLAVLLATTPTGVGSDPDDASAPPPPLEVVQQFVATQGEWAAAVGDVMVCYTLTVADEDDSALVMEHLKRKVATVARVEQAAVQLQSLKLDPMFEACFGLNSLRDPVGFVTRATDISLLVDSTPPAKPPLATDLRSAAVSNVTLSPGGGEEGGGGGGDGAAEVLETYSVVWIGLGSSLGAMVCCMLGCHCVYRWGLCRALRPKKPHHELDEPAARVDLRVQSGDDKLNGVEKPARREEKPFYNPMLGIRLGVGLPTGLCKPNASMAPQVSNPAPVGGGAGGIGRRNSRRRSKQEIKYLQEDPESGMPGMMTPGSPPHNGTGESLVVITEELRDERKRRASRRDIKRKVNEERVLQSNNPYHSSFTLNSFSTDGDAGYEGDNGHDSGSNLTSGSFAAGELPRTRRVSAPGTSAYVSTDHFTYPSPVTEETSLREKHSKGRRMSLPEPPRTKRVQFELDSAEEAMPPPPQSLPSGDASASAVPTSAPTPGTDSNDDVHLSGEWLSPVREQSVGAAGDTTMSSDHVTVRLEHATSPASKSRLVLSSSSPSIL